MSLLPNPSLTGVERPGWAPAGLMSRLVLVVALALLGACSSTTFLYNRLDMIIPWYVGSYVDLEREQKEYLDTLLEPFLVWHRREELPRYILVIDDLETRLDREVSADDVPAISAQFEAAWFRLEGRGIDWMLQLGESLSDEQMAEFRESLRDKQQDYEEKYLGRTDEKFREESYDSLRDNLQDYLGRLTGDQRERLRQASEALLRSDGVWLEEREVWLDRLDVTLQRAPGWQQAIRDDLVRRDETVSTRYREVYSHNLETIHLALADVLNSRSDRQDSRLRSKLGNLREDLQNLIGRDS